MAGVIVEVILQPPVVSELPVGDFALYLHPAVGERDILEIGEPYTHLGHRTAVTAFHEVTARKTIIEKCRFPLFKACCKEHTTITHFPVELLDPESLRTLMIVVPGTFT